MSGGPSPGHRQDCEGCRGHRRALAPTCGNEKRLAGAPRRTRPPWRSVGPKWPPRGPQYAPNRSPSGPRETLSPLDPTRPPIGPQEVPKKHQSARRCPLVQLWEPRPQGIIPIPPSSSPPAFRFILNPPILPPPLLEHSSRSAWGRALASYGLVFVALGSLSEELRCWIIAHPDVRTTSGDQRCGPDQGCRPEDAAGFKASDHLEIPPSSSGPHH